MIGFVYGYQDDLGEWVYVGQALDPKARHSHHLKHPKSFFEKELVRLAKGPTPLRGPIILEEVQGIDRKDLRFNLAWQETIWMFKLKTICKVFGKGMNRVFPYRPFPDTDIARLGGQIGGQRTRELYSRRYSQEEFEQMILKSIRWAFSKVKFLDKRLDVKMTAADAMRFVPIRRKYEAAMKDPKMRDRHRASVKRAMNSPETIALISNQQRLRWQDPVYKAKMTEAMNSAISHGV